MPTPITVAALIDAHLPTVWDFCTRMTLSAADAEGAAYETFERSAHGKVPDDAVEQELWLLKIAAFVVEQRLPQNPEVDFDLLDETLRSEATRTQEVSSLSQAERQYLVWELKQGCMTAVINCLSPGERVAFVLAAVLGKTEEQAAKSLGIKTSAFKVRLSRAKKKIGDYLAPRCEHVDARNPCRCPSRIGVALKKGFIAPPQTAVVQLRTPSKSYTEELKSRDAVGIFRTLPSVEIPDTLRTRLQQL
jgi:RNA polymerase sigma-70 factor (ECF subfamily)